jgi:hypothetical protein
MLPMRKLRLIEVMRLCLRVGRMTGEGVSAKHIKFASAMG